MPRSTPFTTEAEIAEYLSGDLIECLECGHRFRMLTGKHLRLIHDMTPNDYRDRWELPRGTPLAGHATRKLRSEIIKQTISDGAMTYEHLPVAMKLAQQAQRPQKTPASAAAHSARIAELRPGDHSKLPPGAKRADGRDADRAREAQRLRRLNKKLNVSRQGAHQREKNHDQ